VVGARRVDPRWRPYLDGVPDAGDDVLDEPA
jgi:hypothetical protein